MRKFAYLVCLCLLTLVLIQSEIAGQRRVGIPRPRPGQPTQPANPAPAETPRQTSEQPSSQEYKSAIEYQYLMEMRFYENQGGYLVENLEVVFPPATFRDAQFVISRANGGVVNTVPLRLEKPLASYTAFGMFLPNAVAGLAPIGEPGDYVLSVQIEGQTITSMPFSMKREASNDPFNPKNTFVREGPWRDLAHFSVETDDPESHVEFSWWTSLRELPPGTKNPMVTLHVLLGGQEIASTRSPIVPTQTDWQFLRQEFHFPAEPKVRWMTMADLTRRDGIYSVVAKVNGKPYKTYRAEVRGGKLQQHPRSKMDYEPHSGFMSPRQVDTSSRTTSRYSMRDIYWVTKN